MFSKRRFPKYRDESNAGPKSQIRLKASALQHSKLKKNKKNNKQQAQPLTSSQIWERTWHRSHKTGSHRTILRAKQPTRQPATVKQIWELWGPSKTLWSNLLLSQPFNLHVGHPKGLWWFHPAGQLNPTTTLPRPLTQKKAVPPCFPSASDVQPHLWKHTLTRNAAGQEDGGFHNEPQFSFPFPSFYCWAFHHMHGLSVPFPQELADVKESNWFRDLPVVMLFCTHHWFVRSRTCFCFI